MKKTHPICDAMTTKFELPTSEHPLKCSERKEGEEETTNTQIKKKDRPQNIATYIVCVFVGEKPAPQRNQMQFQYIEKPTESEKKPKTGNDKEAEHVKKYLKCGVSHF